MHKLIGAGRLIFATGILALGVLQFLVKDYIVARPPSPAWAADIPGKLAWAYISGFLLIIFGLAIAFNKKAALASVLTGVLIFISSFLLRNLPDMAGVGSAAELLWKVNAYKTLAFFGGSLIVAASFRKERPGSSVLFKNDQLIMVGSVCLALFLIISGIAHFKFDDFVKELVPAYVGNRYFWTYFSAIALLAAGTGLVFRQTRKWVAFLSGVMIFLWFVMLHIPRAIQIPAQDSAPVYGEWMGVFESFSFSGVFFVLTGLSYYQKSYLDMVRS